MLNSTSEDRITQKQCIYCGKCILCVTYSLDIKANYKSFRCGLRKCIVMKHQAIYYWEQTRVVMVQHLISFILFIIPEVIMSWILDAATLLPLLHSALTLNGVCVIITFMLSCMGRHIFWGNLTVSEKRGKKVTQEGWKISHRLRPKHLCHKSSVCIDGIITAINSRGSFGYAN